MPVYNARDVLDVSVRVAGRAGVRFLNWEIWCKPMTARLDPEPSQYAGAGLYGLCFDERLIYIGSYLGGGGRGVADFSGDVVAARWWTHLGAITARGHKMHIAPSSLKSLRARLDPQHPMLTGFLASNDFPTLHKDDGNLSPLRRLLFAAGLSDSFLASNADPLQVLSRFRFVYVRCSEMSNGMNQESLKHHIERAEKELIARLAPLCNTKHVPRDATPVNVVCSDVEDLLMQAMKGKRTQASNPQPSDVLSVPVQPGTHEWADVFWQSLPPEPHFARALVDSLCALAQRNGVQVVYTGTKGSDLRFKVTTESGHHRVFMTLCWQKRVKRFLVRSACTVPQVQNFMGCCMPDESVVGTLPTEPLISEVRIAAEAQRIVVVRQIFLCSMASI